MAGKSDHVEYLAVVALLIGAAASHECFSE